MNNIGRTAANGIGFLGSIRAMDFYRKIPRDLTEPTLAGGTMSLLSTIIMGVLLMWQVRARHRCRTVAMHVPPPCAPAAAARRRLTRTTARRRRRRRTDGRTRRSWTT